MVINSQLLADNLMSLLVLSFFELSLLFFLTLQMIVTHVPTVITTVIITVIVISATRDKLSGVVGVGVTVKNSTQLMVIYCYNGTHALLT